jgi:hypothetical protein
LHFTKKSDTEDRKGDVEYEEDCFHGARVANTQPNC